MLEQIKAAYELAQKARSKGLDPAGHCETVLAETLAQRIAGLLGLVSPELGPKLPGLVEKWERQYGWLDWRVALKIAEEIALGKVLQLDLVKAIELAIRASFAYLTLGVVSSPIDGIVGIELRPRLDGKGKYISISYAGPIRNAGGTAAAATVVIADYLRQLLGLAPWDPQPEEIKRAITELQDYHEKVTNLQYRPSPEELQFLLSNLPIEIDGTPSEEIEVSNWKDLPRIATNRIRSGYCLMLSAALPLKAPKLLKQFVVLKDAFGFDWPWLKEYVKIQKAATTEKSSAPNLGYLSDAVAGRPVLAMPGGGFRLRYGRARNSGYSCQAIHPATGFLLERFLAYGTQIKPERPAKSAALAVCDTIEGPVVLLQDGSLEYIKSLERAKEVAASIKKILHLGDLLISYGDFFNRAQPLAPAGYCEEWWVQELIKAIVKKFGTLDEEKVAGFCECPTSFISRLLRWPITTEVNAETALKLSRLFGIPLHPAWTWHWAALSLSELEKLHDGAKRAKGDTIELALELKPLLEKALIPHRLENGKVILEGGTAQIFSALLEKLELKGSVLETLSSRIQIRDKLGTCVGARMGRPEKAKMRRLATSPHCLFPVGLAGGRTRSFAEALKKGKVKAEFGLWYCRKCGRTIWPICENCGERTSPIWTCCGSYLPSQKCPKGHIAKRSAEIEIDFQKHFNSALVRLGMTAYPELIKGVRGTSSKDHLPERIEKGIIRAKWELAVNKDGTVRYDATQMPLTHFRPKEIGTSIEKLRQLGYEKDVQGIELSRPDQLVELKPQDIILPATEEGADKILYRVAMAIDDELEQLYKLPTFYNLSKPEDLIGHIVVVLAPHTSAGIAARIIGFSKCQALLAHPLLHAATRRDCDGDESSVMLLLDCLLNFSRAYLPESKGSTMDAPIVLIPKIIPKEVDDMVFDIDVASSYPIELYEAAQAYRLPWEVRIEQLRSHIDNPVGLGFTHDTTDINACVRCSAYKLLPTMEEKLNAQLSLAKRLACVDAGAIAQLIIEKHFIRDIKGNLRKFFEQEFRCLECNAKYRRITLTGLCACGGRLNTTVSEGNITKYLELAAEIAKEYSVSSYVRQCIALLQDRVKGLFQIEKQARLSAFA